MKHPIYLILIELILPIYILTPIYSAVEITATLVDGVHNNQEVIILNRRPIFTFEYTLTTTIISTFTVVVSTDINLTSPVWNVVGSTDKINTTTLDALTGKYHTSIEYGYTNTSTMLIPNTTYYWKLTLYTTTGSSATTPTLYFITAISTITLTRPIYDLQVDFNNPFDPQTQITKFRYIVKDTDTKVQIRIYNLSGEYIKTVAQEHLALKNVEYTATWNGTDYTEKIVPSGIYLVNMTLTDEYKGITRRVIVTRR